MNKHQIIRSLSIVFLITLVYTFSRLDIDLIQSKPSTNLSIQEFDWQQDLVSEMEVREFQFESELAIRSEMTNEVFELETLPVFIHAREKLNALSPRVDVCRMDNNVFFVRTLK